MDDELTELRDELSKLKSELDSQREANCDAILFAPKDENGFPVNGPPQTGENVEHIELKPKKNRKKLSGHLSKVYALQWNEDSRHLVSASQDAKMIVWDGYSGNKINVVNMASQWVMTCAYGQSSTGVVACGGLDNVCSIYGLDGDIEENSTERQKLTGHDGFVSCCRFLNDNQMITSSGDQTCMQWDINTGQKIASFEGHTQDVMAISLSPNQNSTFVSGSCDAMAKLWDIREGKCKQTFAKHETDINAVSFLPQGTGFCTGSDDSSIILNDLRADQSLAVYDHADLRSHAGGLTSLAISKSGRLIFAGYDNITLAYIWDTIKGDPIGELGNPNTGHTNRISSLGVTPDGNALCTGSWDTDLRIWN